jgi:hypothetical protein
MFCFDTPVDWHVSEGWEVKKKGKLPGVSHMCENGYGKLRFLSDGKEQWAELLQHEYGLQGSCLAIKPMATTIGTGGAVPSTHWHRGHEGDRAQKGAAAARFRHNRAQGGARSPADEGQNSGQRGREQKAKSSTSNAFSSLVYGLGGGGGGLSDKCFVNAINPTPNKHHR